MSFLELKENWIYLFFSNKIFRLVLNNNLKASNNWRCILCFNWKQASLLFLIKKEPSAFVNPTNQLLKKGKLRYPEAVLGNSKVVGI